MQRIMVIMCATGIAVAVAIALCLSIIPTRVFETEHAILAKKAESMLIVDVPSSNHVQELFSETELARKYYVPGECEIKPAKKISTIVFKTGEPNGLQKATIGTELVLGIDNATGDLVPPPGEKAFHLSENELVDIALSGFASEEYKAGFKALDRDIFMVPGMAIVTFGNADSGNARAPCTLSPQFVYRVWIDTRTKAIFAGEIGN